MGSVPPWFVDVVLAVVLLVAFLGAALLAVVEVSLLRVRTSRVRVEAADGDRRSRDLLSLLDDMPLVLNTVLFLVLLCQVTVAVISGYLAQRWAGGPWVTVVSILVSLVLFVYAESLPKTIAAKAPHERALRSARGLRLLVRLCRPIVAALVAFASVQTRNQVEVDDVVSEPELRLLARQAAKAGVIGADDAELVDRSFVFGDQVVADIMVARQDIVAVSSTDPVADAMHIAISAGHRRIPVYGHDLNDIVGVVRLRDLAAARDVPNVASANVMHKPLFCHPGESIAALLGRMRDTGIWLAIVRNGRCETVGLATVEDIVAELMGEIEEGPAVTPPPV